MTRDPATPYVTNTDRSVFAIRGLSEEDVAVLLAFYSRSAVSLRDALRNALASGDLNPEAGFRELASLMLSHPEGGRPADEAEALYRIAMARTSDSTSAASRAFHEKWVVGYGHGCYDAATDVLTEFGWMAWTELAAWAAKGETLPRLASLNPASGLIEYLAPVRLIAAPYTGPMYRVEAYSVDLLVTPNHMMWVCPTTTRKGREKEDYRLIRADELGHTSCAYQLTGRWEGPEPETITVGGASYPAKELMRLLGFFIGNGFHDDRYHGAVTFHLRRKRKVAFLTELCERAGIDCRRHGGEKFYLRAEGLGGWMKWAYEEDGHKVIPRNVLAYGPGLLAALFEGLMASDGHTGKGGDRTYPTTSPVLRDQLYELALKLGMVGYARIAREATETRATLYCTTFNASRLRPTVNKVSYKRETSEVPYSGTVYCAELPRNHVLYVRRNGIPVWCGNSVAEHAVAHFGIEECSILAAKAIEDSRLGTAFTEQSTRYVPFSRDTLVTAIGLRGDDQTLYEDAARGLLDAYGVVSDAFSVIADREFPSASPAARRGWVLDRARALLPCGTPTRLGVSMNGRAAAAMVRKLSDPTELPEVVRIAGAIREEGAKVLPSLMRRTDMDTGRFSRHHLLDRRPPGDYEPVYERSVTIDGIEAPEARARLTRAMLEDVRGADVRTATRTSQYEDTLRSYMVGRDRFDRPGRALEAIPVRLRLSLDYGAWRDVQRHRVFSAAPVYVRPRSGIDLPDLDLLPKDAQAVALSACTRAQVVGRKLEAEYGPGIAQYVLPLGTLVRATMRGNLRGLVTFIELRSRPEGHDAYRAVAHKLQDALEKDPVLAELAKYIRCDRSPRTLARK